MSDLENNLSSNLNVREDNNTLTTNSSDTVTFKSSLQSKNKNCTCDNTENEKKIIELKNRLIENPESCDFTWSLFQSALNSYRFDSCLRPFPPMFYNNGYKDVTRMRTISNQIPDIPTLINTLHTDKISQDVIQLLHWILIVQKEPYLKILNNWKTNNKLNNIYQNISEKSLQIPPDYVFEVIYSKQQEEQFEKRKNNKDSFYAFHGSRLDNFYSILKFGLQQHLSCKETLFGAGIYLSNELLLSLTYAPGGCSWDKSYFGSNHSIVALCEVINDAECVKCHDKADKNRNLSPGSIGRTIPNNYYVVLNNEFVRVRYLFVFEQSKTIRETQLALKSRFYKFFKKHKMIILLTLYSLLLCFIGFFNSSFWYKIRRTIQNNYDI